ncbi:MAG: WYL domain-containing protein, partial [Proteobacteria bacterium]|nr:WYL domain-containing protein [Pseudomonadota bacterium]MBU4586016.1 WYL domain-containing protein [Pseudomonadota bacterium]
TLALDRIHDPVMRDEEAMDIPDEQLDSYYGGSFGIFSGPPKHAAILRFSPQRARWVAEEQWHSDQQGSWLADGSYQLSLPYGDSRELVLDILRYGPDVEVIAPDELRCEVRERLIAALRQYEK